MPLIARDLDEQDVATGRQTRQAGRSLSLTGTDRRQRGACVTRLAAGRDVLLVEVARYEGHRATVIVAATSASARKLSVWVVGPGCSAARSDVIAHRTIAAR